MFAVMKSENVVLCTRLVTKAPTIELEADHANSRRGELHLVKVREVVFSEHARHPAVRISDIILYGCHVLFTR